MTRIISLRWINVAQLTLAGLLCIGVDLATAQSVNQSGSDRGLSDWLVRINRASERRSYIGTFVVSSADQLASSRIWHVCDGQVQMERVDALSGMPKTTIRRDQEVLTLLPGKLEGVVQNREALAIFPNILADSGPELERYYAFRHLRGERVAGYLTDLLHLNPRDELRFGYRIWSERESGLVVKLQIIGREGRVLEQTVFSELQLDAPVSLQQLQRMMANTQGYRIERPQVHKTTLESEGWQVKANVPGFRPLNCYGRQLEVASDNRLLTQCIFTDGLAPVSLFLENFDPRRHVKEGLYVSGATHGLTRRIASGGQAWWLTLVGEVPTQTLVALASSLSRR